jgi:hypothetical protein
VEPLASTEGTPSALETRGVASSCGVDQFRVGAGPTVWIITGSGPSRGSDASPVRGQDRHTFRERFGWAKPSRQAGDGSK